MYRIVRRAVPVVNRVRRQTTSLVHMWEASRYTPRNMPTNRIVALQKIMEREGLSAWIASDADPHGSEYVAERFMSRSWLSGFRGSAGTLVVTCDTCGLWVDSRYYLEAEEVLCGTPIDLFKVGLPGTPNYPEWLASRLPSGAKVGIDSATTSLAELRKLENILLKRNIELVTSADLLSEIWTDRPALPGSPITEHPLEFAGESREEKLERVRKHMRDRGASALMLSSLDDIAWLTNLRGSDVGYNPVFLAFLLVSENSATLFVDQRKIDETTRASLRSAGIECSDYECVRPTLSACRYPAPILLSAQKTSVAIRRAIPDSQRVSEESDITTSMKARKNQSEINGIRSVMKRDGRAMVRFLRWVEHAVAAMAAGGEQVTELSASEKLHDLRSEEQYFAGPSFRTISGYKAHGAIVHYSVSEQSDIPLGPGMYLVDSGGQYVDGTSDITRTICFGEPHAQAIEDFTLVLKAHIALATVRFPEGTNGTQLDAIPRQHLWKRARNYGHGTGHGVGCFLNVHEGPQRISANPSGVAIEPGMLTSNEPGFYRTGQYGIRIENLILAVEDETGESGRFFRFDTMTLCPIDTRLVDPSLLTDEELDWLNSYNLRVDRELSPLLSGDDLDWLHGRTAPLMKHSASPNG